MTIIPGSIFLEKGVREIEKGKEKRERRDGQKEGVEMEERGEMKRGENDEDIGVFYCVRILLQR